MKSNFILLFFVLSNFIIAQENAIIIQNESNNKVNMSIYSNGNFRKYTLELKNDRWEVNNKKVQESAESFINNTGVYNIFNINNNINELITKIEQGDLVKKNFYLMKFSKDILIDEKFIKSNIFKYTDENNDEEKIEILSTTNILIGIIILLNLIVLVILLLNGRKNKGIINNQNLQHDNKTDEFKPKYNEILSRLESIQIKLGDIIDINQQLYDIQFANKSAGTTHIEKIKELLKDIYKIVIEYKNNDVAEDGSKQFEQIEKLINELPNKIMIPEVDLSDLNKSINEIKSLIENINNNNSRGWI